MSTATIPNIFVANTIIQSAAMNANFNYLTNLLNVNVLPAVGVANSVVTTDVDGNFQASTYASIVTGGVPLTTKGDLLTYSTTAARQPVGSNGQLLIADSTQATGLRWGNPSASSEASQLYNVGLQATAASGILTVALKQQDGTTDPDSVNPSSIGMRASPTTSGAYNVRTVIAPLSQTITLGTTLGVIPGQQQNNLYTYAIDTDGLGTMALGLSTVLLEEGDLQDVVRESSVATISIASPGVITETAHGRKTNDRVTFTTTGALPTGITVGTRYCITVTSANTYTLSTSPGGLDAVATTGTQSGVHTVRTADTSFVSGGVYTGVAVRLIGRVTVKLAVAGTWITPIRVGIKGSFLEQDAIGLSYNIITTTFNPDNNNLPINFDTLYYDTHGMAVRSGRLRWFVIAPKTGLYDIAMSIGVASGSTAVLIQRNVAPGNTARQAVVFNATPVPNSGAVKLWLNRGDYIFASFENSNQPAQAFNMFNMSFIGSGLGQAA